MKPDQPHGSNADHTTARTALSRNNSVLRLFYSMGLAIFLGFIAAMVATRATERGILEDLFGEVPERPTLNDGGNESVFVLSEIEPAIEGVVVSVRLPHHLVEHSKRVSAEWVKRGGLSESLQVLELVVRNDSQQGLNLADTPDLFIAKVREGTSVPHQPWPPHSGDPETERVLVQKRPQGSVAAKTQRSFWLLVPSNFELEVVESAQLTFEGGQQLKLEPIALPAR